MKSELKRVIDYANSTIGIKEYPPGSNNVIFNTRYYGAPVSGASYPWCCVYIWDIFAQTGLSHIFCDGAKTASCQFVKDWAIRSGRFSRTEVDIGDLVLLNFSKTTANENCVAEHIGIIVDRDPNWNYITIEGNTGGNNADGGAVMKRTRYFKNTVGIVRLSDLYGGEDTENKTEIVTNPSQLSDIFK